MPVAHQSWSPSMLCGKTTGPSWASVSSALKRVGMAVIQSSSEMPCSVPAVTRMKPRPSHFLPQGISSLCWGSKITPLRLTNHFADDGGCEGDSGHICAHHQKNHSKRTGQRDLRLRAALHHQHESRGIYRALCLLTSPIQHSGTLLWTVWCSAVLERDKNSRNGGSCILTLV